MDGLTHISFNMWLVNTSEWIAEGNSDVHSTCPIFRSQYQDWSKQKTFSKPIPHKLLWLEIELHSSLEY
jgi:hypothetical protein